MLPHGVQDPVGATVRVRALVTQTHDDASSGFCKIAVNAVDRQLGLQGCRYIHRRAGCGTSLRAWGKDTPPRQRHVAPAADAPAPLRGPDARII